MSLQNQEQKGGKVAGQEEHKATFDLVLPCWIPMVYLFFLGATEKTLVRKSGAVVSEFPFLRRLGWFMNLEHIAFLFVCMCLFSNGTPTGDQSS